MKQEKKSTVTKSYNSLLKMCSLKKKNEKKRKKVKMFRNETGLETVAVQNLEDHENQM